MKMVTADMKLKDTYSLEEKLWLTYILKKAMTNLYLKKSYD